MELILDVNTQLYPVNLNDKFRLMIATTLRDDGVPDEGEYEPNVSLSSQSSTETLFRLTIHARRSSSTSCTARSTASRAARRAVEVRSGF